MTEKEFWQKIKNYGINLNLFQIAFGHKTDEMYYSGIFEDKNGKWNFYKVEDRNLVSVRYKGNKNTAIDYLYNSLLAQIWEHGYNSQYITNDVIQTPKFVVCNFLQKKYSISKSEAENIWNYLMRDFDVLNEVKYFALNNKFVPEDDCYKVQGYSAQNVHELLGLNIFDSFIYLIKLEKDDISKYLTKLESAKKMTKEEFLKKIDSYGINLNLYSIAIGYRTDRMYYSGIYQDNGKWVVYQVGDQNRVVALYKGTEEEAYEELYDILFVLIRSEGYINQSITKNVIQTSEDNVCRFLDDKYSTNKISINDTWNYLKWDFHVLNELKYFALYNKFVPEDDCYKVQDYSAQDVHELLGLNIFDSFVYLIKLEKDATNEYLTRLESAKVND